MNDVSRTIVSHHFIRRTARARAARLNKNAEVGIHYTVVPTKRGPFRYRVERSRI